MYIYMYFDQLLGSIDRRNDSLGGIPGRELGKLIYGPNNPLVRQSTRESVQNIDRSSLFEMHQLVCRPDNAIMSVVGDFDTKKIVSVLEKNVASVWKTAAKDSSPPTLPDLESMIKRWAEQRSQLGKVGLV